MYDHNFLPSLVASLFSWRSQAPSTSSFLHAAINLRPPSVTVSTHIYLHLSIYLPIYLSIYLSIYLCLQRRRFPTPRYSKRPDVALYAVGPLFLLPTPPPAHCSAPSSFPNMIHSGNRPPLIIRMSAPTHKSHLVHNVVSMLSHPVISSVMSIIRNESK